MKIDLKQYKDTHTNWDKGQFDRARNAIALGDRMCDQRQGHKAAEHYREALNEASDSHPIPGG